MKKELELKYFPLLENDLNKLLQEKLKLAKKADVMNFLNAITPIAKTFKDLQLEFFKKHGKEKDGQYFLPPGLPEKITKEYEEMGDKLETVPSFKLKWNDIQNISSEYPYYALLKVLSTDNKKTETDEKPDSKQIKKA
jgi:hypothetical protein